MTIRDKHDADGGVLRGFPHDQGRDGLVEHVGREQQETDADDLKGTPLGGFPAGLIKITSQPPQGCEAARDLDSRVQPEADERDAPGQKPGRERDHALARVPGDGEVLKGAASADRNQALFYRGPPSVIFPYFIMISPIAFSISPRICSIRGDSACPPIIPIMPPLIIPPLPIIPLIMGHIPPCMGIWWPGGGVPGCGALC